MRQTPRLALALLALAATTAAAHDGCKPDAARKEKPKPSAELVAALRAHGYSVGEDLTILHEASGARIGLPLQQKACLDFDASGAWVHLHASAGPAPVGAADLPEILRGLRQFAAAAETDPKAAGRFLAEKGVPPVYNGLHLVDPDGSATYFGLMFYQNMKDKKIAMSAKRLAEALDLFRQAHAQAFREKTPSLAVKDLDRAAALLTGPLLPGDSPLPLRPYTPLGDGVAAYRGKLADATPAGAGFDPATQKQLEEGLATLNALERTRYHDGLKLPKVPAPPEKKEEPKPAAQDEPKPEEKGNVLQRSLPALLALLERFYGPLSAQQKEALIKSFPMGELVWRLGAHEFWKQGLTGKGVRACVFDSGVSPTHPELRDRVARSFNALDPEAVPKVGDHATHVAGIILAIAPEAIIYSYRVIRDDDESGRTQPSSERYHASFERAMNQALADGCHIVNMSLYSDSSGDLLATKIAELAAAGVIVIVAAANEGAGGIRPPSIAPRAWTVGSLDSEGRMWVTSSHGVTWDLRNGHRVKVIYMMPGHMINSPVAPTPDNPAPYARWTGTSMAAPGLVGVLSLIGQSLPGFTDAVNPLRAAQAQLMQQAIEGSARPMLRLELPPTAPSDQQFLVVNPWAAYERLSSAGVAAR